MRRREKISISFYDLFLLVIFAATMVRPELFSGWMLLLLIVWERPFVIVRLAAESARRQIQQRKIEKDLKDEKNV